MDISKIQSLSKRLLLGFVLVTIGFSIGRRTAPQPEAAAQAPAAESASVVVYAAHMTFRCPECTQIEALARELVEKEFKAQLDAGRLEFKTIDYMRDTAFAKRYNIASSTVVVVRNEAGVERGFERLDEVWTKVNDREAYFVYVREAIAKALGKEATP